MANRTHSFIVALLACVALAGGVAWAMQSQTIDLPSGPQVRVDAVLVPGADGGGVAFRVGAGWTNEEDLSIDFGPDGLCSVNGGQGSAYVAANQHSVRVDIIADPTGFSANVAVYDDVTSSLVLSESGIDLGVDAPATATATGEVVLELTAQ